MIEVFETEEDFEGIHIDYLDPFYETVRNKFTHPFVYELDIIHFFVHFFNSLKKSCQQEKPSKSILSK
ncbi:hypothetical protein ACEQPO_00895 [Bacillus sp. SL00103]